MAPFLSKPFTPPSALHENSTKSPSWSPLEQELATFASVAQALFLFEQKHSLPPSFLPLRDRWLLLSTLCELSLRPSLAEAPVDLLESVRSLCLALSFDFDFLFDESAKRRCFLIKPCLPALGFLMMTPVEGPSPQERASPALRQVASSLHALSQWLTQSDFQPQTQFFSREQKSRTMEDHFFENMASPASDWSAFLFGNDPSLCVLGRRSLAPSWRPESASASTFSHRSVANAWETQVVEQRLQKLGRAGLSSFFQQTVEALLPLTQTSFWRTTFQSSGSSQKKQHSTAAASLPTSTPSADLRSMDSDASSGLVRPTRALSQLTVLRVALSFGAAHELASCLVLGSSIAQSSTSTPPSELDALSPETFIDSDRVLFSQSLAWAHQAQQALSSVCVLASVSSDFIFDSTIFTQLIDRATQERLQHQSIEQQRLVFVSPESWTHKDSGALRWASEQPELSIQNRLADWLPLLLFFLSGWAFCGLFNAVLTALTFVRWFRIPASELARSWIALRAASPLVRQDSRQSRSFSLFWKSRTKKLILLLVANLALCVLSASFDHFLGGMGLGDTTSMLTHPGDSIQNAASLVNTLSGNH